MPYVFWLNHTLEDHCLQKKEECLLKINCESKIILKIVFDTSCQKNAVLVTQNKLLRLRYL